MISVCNTTASASVAIAAEDVPGARQHDELQHHITGEVIVIVADQARDREHEDRDRDTDHEERARSHGRSYRPSRPAGLKASVSSRRPNATAGAQEGP